MSVVWGVGCSRQTQIPNFQPRPTAAGSADIVATAMLRIKEVCARHDAHAETFMADFRSFADNLDHCQPPTPASFALINDDEDNEEDKAIHIFLSIDDADEKIKDIAAVLAPSPPLPHVGAVCPSWGGGCPLLTPNMLSAFELATVPPQETAC